MAKEKTGRSKDTRTQQQRFMDFAREHGATEDVLDKALGEVASDAAQRRQQPKPEDKPQD